MTSYRITKYNPSLRLADGRFTGAEWTSIGDIGQIYPAGAFEFSDYLKTEDAYVESVRRFLSTVKIGSLFISGLEMKNDHTVPPEYLTKELDQMLFSIHEGEEISGLQIDLVVRLNLRELIWCRLKGKNGTYVHFGYDYYMYLGCQTGNFVFSQIPAGMFAEPFETPYGEENVV
jgi:hypothetical protein